VTSGIGLCKSYRMIYCYKIDDICVCGDTLGNRP